MRQSTPADFDATQTELCANCPRCMGQFSQAEFDEVNAYAALLDRRPGVQRPYKGDKRRKPKLFKRAMMRLDGVRRMAFYVDHDIDAVWLAGFLIYKYESVARFPITRARIIQDAQQHLVDHGRILDISIAPEMMEVTLRHIIRLFPDLRPEYGTD
jgi:hypothetical protein